MVYNFALPPLVVVTFQTGDSSHLTRWASGLDRVSETATYLNFLDSHDGIGLLPIQDIVPATEIETMIERTREHGGLVSYRVDRDGNRAPYELNITWWSVINRADSDESLELQINRYLASRSIALVLRGVPALYLIGAVGSRNDLEAVQQTGDKRSINRTALDAEALSARLGGPRTPYGPHCPPAGPGCWPDGRAALLSTPTAISGSCQKDRVFSVCSGSHPTAPGSLSRPSTSQLRCSVSSCGPTTWSIPMAG